MIKKFFIFFFFLILVGCHFERIGYISISVTSQNTPVAGSNVKIMQFTNSGNHDQIIAQSKTDQNGQITFNIDFSLYQDIKIIVSHDDLVNLYLPEVKYVTTPSWWQEQSIHKKFELKKLSISSKTNEEEENPKKMTTKRENFVDFPDDQQNEALSIFQIEKNLPSQIIKLKPKETQLNIPINEEKKEQTISNNPISLEKVLPQKELENTIQLSNLTQKNEVKNILYEDSLQIEVFDGSKPIENAEVFVGKNSTQNFSFAGNTNNNGFLSFSMPKFLRSDIILVSKPSYLNIFKPILSGSGKKTLRIDLQPGQSTNYILQNFAYEIGRGFDKTELYVDGAKLDVSGPLGFVTSSKVISDKSKFSLKQKNSIPDEIDNATLKKISNLKTPSTGLGNMLLFVSALTPYKPSVGLIEPPLIGALQSNTLWRRFRREFYSRFMNESLFRSMISDEVTKRANSIELSAVEMATKGWKNTSFSADLDLIIQIKLIDEEQGANSVEGKIIDKNGRIFIQSKMSLSNLNTEETAAKLYLTLVSALPIEGSVIKKNKSEYTINLGKKHSITIGDTFVALVPQTPFSPPEKPIAILKVIALQDNECQTSLKVREDLLNKEKIIRIVRFPEALADQEVTQKIAVPSEKFSTHYN